MAIAPPRLLHSIILAHPSASRRLMPRTSKSPAPESTSTHRVPVVSHDYRENPLPYPALKTEQGVFTTPPYSATLKGLWRFKDEESARESAGRLWERFERYR